MELAPSVIFTLAVTQAVVSPTSGSDFCKLALSRSITNFLPLASLTPRAETEEKLKRLQAVTKLL